MKKNRLTNIILIIIFLVGLSLLLYPTVSDYVNSLHQSTAISEYVEDVASLNPEEYEEILEKARQYNQNILNKSSQFEMTEDDIKEYNTMLNASGNGVMGYVEIPAIHCSLPLYHGTEDSVLQSAVGHIEWSSLPVGGESTHAVLSGHRGLPSAKLFTNLDKLKTGDTFMLRVLDETLTYEVDQILIVEPNQTEALMIEKGKDYCTLVTCTPYGINSHRLLVRGRRIENVEDSNRIRVTADAMQIEPIMMAPVIAAPILLLLILSVFFGGRKKNRKKKD